MTSLSSTTLYSYWACCPDGSVTSWLELLRENLSGSPSVSTWQNLQSVPRHLNWSVAQMG
ncbi:hypothetical protein A6R68_03850 [Neotoma lepida]|uniref:Uncharacterized protein n=1 Tax=Neotoma lepida TaxID=56216 RepID=A0A1A6GQF0_NEOLE|nr:hypothetical protein A6R68_03850 [Neotoma lepida]